MEKKPDAQVAKAGAGPWKAKRRHERIGVELSLLVSMGEGKLIVGRTIDISEGGLGATLRERCPVERVVELQFALQSSPVPMHIRSLTVYSSETRHGFQFLKLAPEQRQAIAALVAGGKKRPAAAQADSTPQQYKFGGKHEAGCVCPTCGGAGGTHTADCLCDACGSYGGEHSSSCRCMICRVPAGKHAAECRCPRCGAAG